MEKMWSGKEILLFFSVMKKESEGDEFAAERYTEDVPSLEDVDEALRCVCLQWKSESSVKMRHDVQRKVEKICCCGQ